MIAKPQEHTIRRAGCLLPRESRAARLRPVATGNGLAYNPNRKPAPKPVVVSKKVLHSSGIRTDGKPYQLEAKDGRRRRWECGARSVVVSHRELEAIKARLSQAEMRPADCSESDAALFDRRLSSFINTLFSTVDANGLVPSLRIEVSEAEYNRVRRQWQPHMWLPANLVRGVARKLVAERVRDLLKRTLRVVLKSPSTMEEPNGQHKT